MTLNAAVQNELAEALWVAEKEVNPIAPLTQSYSFDVADAYQIQLINIRRRVAAGAQVAGHKVGLASKAMQEMMKVNEPDYGHLLDEMQYFPNQPIDATQFCAPRVEVEVGFILGKDLPGSGCTLDDVIAAIDWVVPAIELIDSRIKDWSITLCDTIADNASSLGWILGAERRRLDTIDVANIDAVLRRNSEVVASGNSAEVLGNPLTAVSWLANRVESFGVRLKAGDVILPGTATRAIEVRPGDYFEAEFIGLGSVTADFRA